MLQIFNDISHACSRITTERYSTSFGRAIRVLHPDLRGPVYDIYGFVRFADEIVDTFHDFDKARLLELFKEETYRALNTGISLNPILNSFQITVNKYGIGRELIDTFFFAMETDISKREYDQAGYKSYIYGSAETVGLMCLAIFCEDDTSAYEKLQPSAQSLGAAFQKINFLRDIRADHEQLKRTYFPGLDLKNFSEADKLAIEADIISDLEKAYKGILQLPAKARFGVYLAYKYYLSLFKKIRRSKPALLLQSRVRINNTGKAFIYVQAGLRNSFNIL